MKFNKNMFKVVSVTAVLALMLLVSCSKVNFAGQVENVGGDMNHSSYVRFDVDWNCAGETLPEEMTLLMNRIQNVTVHYAWRIDNTGEPIAPVAETEQEEEPSKAGESDPDYEVEIDEGENTDGETGEDGTGEEDAPEQEPAPIGTNMLVQNGLYTIMGVAAHNQEDYFIPEIESYEDSLDYKTKDLYVVIPEIPDSVRFKQNLVDLNPMCPFIRAVDPMYFVRSDNNALISQVKESPEDGVVTVPVTAQKLTHNFNFKLLLKTEGSSRVDGVDTEVKDSVVGVVYLDTLKAAISGLPAKAQLMSGYLTDQNTGKMGFNMKKSSDSRVNDTTTELTLYEGTYEGSVNAFGLFPAINMEYLTGPGILNVFLYPKIYYENAYGKKVALTRIFHASLNIKEEIDAAKIMVQVPDRDYYVYGKDGDTDLIIRTSIILSYEDVLSGTSQGLKEWTTNEINPDHGFNPGLEM